MDKTLSVNCITKYANLKYKYNKREPLDLIFSEKLTYIILNNSNIIFISNKVNKEKIPSFLTEIDKKFLAKENIGTAEKDIPFFPSYTPYCFKKKVADCLKFAEQVASKKYIDEFVAEPSEEPCVFKVGDNATHKFGCSDPSDNYVREKIYADEYKGPSNYDANPEPGEAFAIVDLDKESHIVKLNKEQLLEGLDLELYQQPIKLKMSGILKKVVEKLKSGEEIGATQFFNNYMYPYLNKTFKTDKEKIEINNNIDELYDLIEQIYKTNAERETDRILYHYHVATVIFKDGDDRITLEQCGNDIKYPKFDIYTIGSEENSFHGFWKKQGFKNPKTIVLKPIGKNIFSNNKTTISTSGAAAAGAGGIIGGSKMRKTRSKKKKKQRKTRSKRKRKQKKTRSKRKRKQKKTRSKRK